jgi:GWxTD domain-containing protein
MKRLLSLVLISLPLSMAFSQPLTSLNFREWYNPDSEIQFSLQVVKEKSQIKIYYLFQTKQFPADKYSISWEKRDAFTQQQGTAINNADTTSITTTDKTKGGAFTFEIPAKPWLLVAKITNTESKISWTYVKLIEPKYPVNGWLDINKERVAQKYVIINKEYTVHSEGSSPLFVSFYKTDFPAASPPFADLEKKPDRFMFYDSSFKVNPGSKFTPQKPGLYLFQQDTNAAEGFAFRCVNEIYPKFSKISDLIGPMIFVTTQDEYTALLNTQGEKARFDKVILDITGDQDRAKNFIRNYFRRVELANIYFSSFKQGWKTDRGMIYLIFGIPDEVSMNDGTEIWFYKATRQSFTFVKSGSVYDPENYVLLRDKRFMEPWFSRVDLLRKSRF